MKKFRKIMAVLVAALMIAATMVPAWAAPTSDDGRLEDTAGSITIQHPGEGELYNIYRLFELASFTDDDIDPVWSATAADNHHDKNGEHYSYVINEYLSDGQTANPWWTFLRTYGPSGTPTTSSNYAYAYTMGTSTPEDPTTVAAYNNAYFLIDEAPVTVDGISTYHIIKAGPKFEFRAELNDDPLNANDNRIREQGDGKDYTTSNNKLVQNFAQEALKFAKVQVSGGGTGTVDQVSPTATGTGGTASGIPATPPDLVITKDTNNDNLKLGYYLISSGMGALAILDTTNHAVTVQEKNDEPTIQKKVLKKGKEIATSDYENSAFVDSNFTDTNWVDNTDANVGDYVPFRVRIRAQQGIQGYTLHDVMEDGISFIDNANVGGKDYSVKVKLVRLTDPQSATIDASASKISAVYDILRTATGEISSESVSGINWSVVTADSAAADGSDAKKAYNERSDFVIKFLNADTGTFGNNKFVFLAQNAENGELEFVDVRDDDLIYVYYYAKVENNAVIFKVEENRNTYSAENPSASDYSQIVRNDGSTMVNQADNVQYKANGNGRNDNYTILTYGTYKDATKWDNASITTYGFDVVKTEDGTTSYNLLKDAKFKLYRAVEGTSSSNDYAVTTGTGTDAETKYYKKSGSALVFSETNKYLFAGANATVEDGVATDTLVSLDTAELYIRGLTAGDYLLEEVEAPKGYDKLAYPIAIEIIGDADYDGVDDTNESKIIVRSKNNQNKTDKVMLDWDATITAPASAGGSYTYDAELVDDNGTPDDDTDDTRTPNAGLKIVNYTGLELPSTGGMGTTVLYIVGGMLVILAGAYLFFSRKRTA